MTTKILTGELMRYDEQGMEGGDLIIVEKTYKGLGPAAYTLSNGSKVWDHNDNNRSGIITATEAFLDNRWLPFPDPICHDKDYQLSSLFLGESKGDREADRRLSRKYHFTISYAVERLNDLYGNGNWRIDRHLPFVILNDGSHVHLRDTPTTTPSRPYSISTDTKMRFTVRWHDGVTQYHVSSDNLFVEQWDLKGLHRLNDTDMLKVLDPVTNRIICEGRLNTIPLKVFSDTPKGHFEHDSSGHWEQYFSGGYFAELHRYTD
ncbi:hypothetical protein [Arsenicibacter rosenii]|uniref:Uncharacterized protein n=1 Tax=Arsenicibacter rosenii TaxID=1750698 RepID=A0A1S2VF48_9BACT|nr:hypothetical protein [Arsenicibacter rosenii]OIN57040.1 hypothetical protein BLX24_22100 [Arsenicibacter rosenii]